MTEIGYVTSIKGEYASVAFKRKSGCGDNCGSCKAGCSASSTTTEIKNILGAQKGDKVKVEMKQSAFNSMILWVYVLPLAMLAIGIGVGTNVFKNLGYENYEILSFLAGIAALAVSYLILNKVSKKTSKNSEYALKMIDIIRS